MGTRALYFFEDSDGVYGAYKHYDGYPSGAMWFIENAKEYAWALDRCPNPRFEADDFAAGFVAANKAKGGGEVRLLRMFDDTSIDMVVDDHIWCDYYYVIKYDRDIGDLHVTVFQSEGHEWEQIASMPHQVMLKAYAEAS